MKIQRLPRLIETAPRLCLIALALASLWLGGGSAFAEPRTWQLGDGEWVTAEFLTMANQQVTLLRESDHSRVTYPLDQLGREDRKWLEGRASTRSEPLEPARLAALVRIPDDAEGIISLPLRVYLVNGVEMRKDGVSMRTWITPKEVEETLIPEINRIWRVAGIQWTLECVIDQPVAEIPDQREAIAYVQNSSRQADGEIGRKRVTTIQDLSGIKDRHPVVHNLYLFPFLGSTYQGFATVSGNTAFLGTWTNKPSRGKKPPQRCLLVESEPMKLGSLARTAAHELGHNLSLHHSDKNTQTELKRLMGGIDQGYRLVPEEIKQARSAALDRARKIIARTK